MEKRMFDDNIVTISGEIVSDFTFDHEVLDEKFYKAYLSAKRDSGVADVIPITISERLADMKENWRGRKVRVRGQFRSYNRHEGDKGRTFLSVFVKEFEEVGEIPFWYDENSIFLDGFLCKNPIYRKTPLGREITNILLAANRPYGKSDYIPCITWGRNARFSSSFEVGTQVKVEGRVQSREYQKKIADNEYETRTAYEVSVNKINIVKETENRIHEKEN